MFDNLLKRQFDVDAPDLAYVADITYIWTREGWLEHEFAHQSAVGGGCTAHGDCWDNEVAESFFGSLKQERVHWQNYQTRIEAQQNIQNYISMFYNSRRLHSYLGYQSPNQYEQNMATLEKAA